MYKLHTLSENERIIKIINFYNAEKKAMKTYSDFREEIKAKRINEDLTKIADQTKSKFRSLISTAESQIVKVSNELNEIQFPNISKSSNLYGDLSFGAMEYNNAILLHEKKPANIVNLLKEALEHHRNEFVFWVIDFYLNDSEINVTEKRAVNDFYQIISERLNITEKLKQKEELEAELVEAKGYLELIERSVEEFEGKISLMKKTALTMYENGQYNGKAILLSWG